MAATVYPGTQWEDARTDRTQETRLAEARSWLDNRPGEPRYRVALVQSGRLVVEWHRGVDPEELLGLASAAKSVFSCMLAIAVDEGKIESADARVVDFYPEMMDVPEGEGPKEGRYAFPKDAEITFRQLISNTSGYMKPGEEPGEVFHYQTYGMNILTHAIAKAYGYYDPADASHSPGLEPLVNEKLRDPMGASWSYRRMNFDLHQAGRLGIFGNYDGISATARDMARLGWLWCNWGRWGSAQLVPEAWLKEAACVAPDIREHCPREQWQYGYGFWTNEFGLIWPSLPRDSFAASGAGRQHIWVCPSLALVVVQSPGVYAKQHDEDQGLLSRVVAALG